MLKSRFRRVLVRGDSAFARQDIFDACDDHGMSFAMVSPAHPNSEELANHAFLVFARLAHNLKAWLAMLALPREAMRWRFRKAFVYVAARIVLTARSHVLHLAGSRRFTEDIKRGIIRLQT
jgi:hypothetical protein